MSRKVGSVAAVAALVVLAGVAVPGTVGGAPTAPLGGEVPSPAAPAVATGVDGGGTSAGGGTNSADGTTSDDAENSTGNASLGTQVSSFMAASAADAETEVESGMFRAEWNRSNDSQRGRLLDRRTETIAERIAELREEREELLAAENPSARERARAAWLATQSDGLARSIERMSEAANRTNVAVDRNDMAELRRSARNLSAGEVAELTPNVVDRGNDRRGPPGETGPPDDREARGNGTDGAPDEPGQSGDDGSGDDPGNGDGGAGASEDGGPGNGNGSGGSGNSGDGGDGGDSSGDGNGSDEGDGPGNGDGSGGSGNSGDGGDGNGDEGNGSGGGDEAGAGGSGDGGDRGEAN